MAKTIKVSGVIDRQLHARVKGIAAQAGVAFGEIVKWALEQGCDRIEQHPGILRKMPKDGRISA